jgi:hypothetical protein
MACGAVARRVTRGALCAGLEGRLVLHCEQRDDRRVRHRDLPMSGANERRMIDEQHTPFVVAVIDSRS